MPGQEEIEHYSHLLATYRRTLKHWLAQAAIYGSVKLAPPMVDHGIQEARDNIKYIKASLKDWGILIEDHPYEEDNHQVTLETQTPFADPNTVVARQSNEKPSLIYSNFQADLVQLIQYATSNFQEIKKDASFVADNGSISYKSRFSFEYSSSNIIWCRANGTWYFRCLLCENTAIQQAEMIFMERVQEIKLALSSDWRFEEKHNPNDLYKRTFEATKKYNALRIRMTLTVYDPMNNTQIEFVLEPLES